MRGTMRPDGNPAWLDIQSEVRDAIAGEQAVVALESTIICHGMRQTGEEGITGPG